MFNLRARKGGMVQLASGFALYIQAQTRESLFKNCFFFLPLDCSWRDGDAGMCLLKLYLINLEGEKKWRQTKALLYMF